MYNISHIGQSSLNVTLAMRYKEVATYVVCDLVDMACKKPNEQMVCGQHVCGGKTCTTTAILFTPQHICNLFDQKPSHNSQVYHGYSHVGLSALCPYTSDTCLSLAYSALDLLKTIGIVSM